MEPFRALVADMIPADQSTLGFSIQTFLIGIGAVVGSWLPYVMAQWFGISKVAVDGGIPDNVVFSFYIGAAVMIIAILWTISTTKEYSPEELAGFNADKEIIAEEKSKFSDIFRDIVAMPKTMKQLAPVQFFSWIALFGMRSE